MTNKHFCQGPECHTNPTTDRFLKSKGIIRGRYAYATVDGKGRYGWNSPMADRFFCGLGCKLDWLNENMTAIEMGIPVPFIRERRITEGYRKVKNSQEYGYNYSTIQKIDLDNDNG